MAASAAHEAAGLTYKCPGTDKNRTTTKNSSRTVRRMLKRLGMNWNIPITTAQFPVNGADDLEVHYIDPIDLFGYLLDREPAILFGGMKMFRNRATF